MLFRFHCRTDMGNFSLSKSVPTAMKIDSSK